MSYNISLIEGEPSYESLPALKITNFLKSDIYRPYTQIKPATNGEKIYIEFIIFEAKPEPQSKAIAVLKGCGACIVITVDTKAMDCKLIKNDGNVIDISKSVNAHRFDGEDLQGIYWGWDVSFLAEDLFLGESFSSLKGNFYKTSDGKSHHFASLFKADNTKALTDEDNLKQMQLSSY